MAYWTTAGLGRLAQSESGNRPDLVHYPSGYTSSGVKSSASGLYGYLDSTWQTYATKAGVDTTLYPRAYLAPASVQTQVAAITPTSHWTCTGCNSTANTLAGISRYTSATPVATTTVTSGGDNPDISFTAEPPVSNDFGGGSDLPSSATSGSDSGTVYSTGNDFGGGSAVPDVTDSSAEPATGGVNDFGGGSDVPSVLGDVAGAAVGGALGGSGGTATGLPDIGKYAWDKLIRVGLIVLGIVLIAVAAWGVVRGEANPIEYLKGKMA